jgi:hypothetical protein
MTVPVKRAGTFAESMIGDEVVLMRLDNGELLSLKEPAATIWRLIDGRRGCDDINRTLAEEFNGTADVVARDVEAFLAELRGAGLIDWN